VKLAKKASGPYDDGLGVAIPDGVTKTRYVRVRSTVEHNQAATLFEERQGDGPSYRVRWFRGKTNISKSVRQGGHEFTLKPVKARRFRVTIKAPEAAQPLCLFTIVGVQPEDVSGLGLSFINNAGCAVPI
jgi:hypothetical protein